MSSTPVVKKPQILNDNIIAEQVQGEYVVYDGKHKRAHRLNPTLTWIWDHCDGSRTVDELALAIKEQTGENDAAAIIASGLKQLADANLLVPESVDLNVVPASTVSRRAVMAQVAMVAPMITSMVVPTAAAAKSKPDKIKDADNIVDHSHFNDDVEPEAKDLKNDSEDNSKGKVQAGKDEKDKEGKDKGEKDH